MASQSTIETLRESALNLTKSNSMQCDNTQQAYLLTMAQLMKAEGIESPTFEETAYVARFEQMQKLDKEILAKQGKLEALNSQIYRAKSEIADIEIELTEQKKKAEKATSKKAKKVVAGDTH